MQSRQLGILVLTIAVCAALVGGVLAYQRPSPEAGVQVDAPTVRVETDKPSGQTSVDAPFARVDDNANGTHVQAPGVDIQVPKKSVD